MSGGRPTQRDDAKRAHHIAMEIIVDANGPEEEAMGWYCHLENTLCFPFTATCIADQVTPIRSTNLVTRQAVADWHYWVGSGRTF